MRLRAMIAVAPILLASSCGYHVVKLELPVPSGGCVHFDGLDGGEAHPELAAWASDELKQRLGPDLCGPGEAGTTLTGTVEWVTPDVSLTEVAASGQSLAGGTWIAAATIRIVADGETIWGPEGVEVRRDFLSTASPVTEHAALQSHLQLLATALGEALADLLHDPSVR
jgi:hypothetical protein